MWVKSTGTFLVLLIFTSGCAGHLADPARKPLKTFFFKKYLNPRNGGIRISYGLKKNQEGGELKN